MGLFDNLFLPNIEKLKNNRDIAGLNKALEHEKPEIQLKAAAALGELGPAAVGVLRQGQQNASKALRLAIVTALGKIMDEQVKSLFNSMAGDPDPRIRVEIAKAASRPGVQGMDAALLRLARDKDGEVRLAAYAGIGSLRSPEAVRALEQAYAQPLPDPERKTILDTLAGMGVSIGEFLVRSWREGSPQTRLQISETLNRTGLRPTAGLAWYYAATGKWGEIITLGDEALEVLDELVKDKDANTRQNALNALIQLDTPGALARQAELARGQQLSRAARLEILQAIASKGRGFPAGLIDALCKDPESTIRLAAAAHAHSFELLMMLTHDKAEAVSLAAIEQLGRLDDERAVPALQKIIAAEEVVPAQAATLALGGQGVRALPALAKLQKHVWATIRRNAIQAIRRIGTPEAAVLLGESATDRDAEACAGALEAIAELAALPDCRAALTAALDDPTPNGLMERLLRAAGRFTEWGVFRAALRAMGALGDPRATAPLEKLIATPLLDQRAALVEALTGLGWQGLPAGQENSLPALAPGALVHMTGRLNASDKELRGKAFHTLMILYKANVLNPADRHQLLFDRAMLERNHTDRTVGHADYGSKYGPHMDQTPKLYEWSSSDCGDNAPSHTDNTHHDKTSTHEDIPGFGAQL